MAIFGFGLENEIPMYQFVLETGIENLGFQTQIWKLWFLVAEQKSNN